jgi:hypothetical protein
MSRRESNSTDFTQERVSEFRQTSQQSLQDAVEKDNIVIPAEKGIDEDYAAALAFMEEEVTVEVMQTSDPNAEQVIQVWNNGQMDFFQRGVPKRTKRKFLDCLIVMEVRVTTPEVFIGAGEKTRSIQRHVSPKYPFVVMQDSDKGREWLRTRMQQI